MRAAQQGSLRLYQCHCVLPINLFNEKICSIWWFYIALLLPVTISSVVLWAVRCWTPSRLEFIGRYIIKEGAGGEDQSALFPFVHYLGFDGLFLLRLIEINHGSCVLTSIIQSLYNRSNRTVPNISQPEASAEDEDSSSRQTPPPSVDIQSQSSLNPFNFTLPSMV